MEPWREANHASTGLVLWSLACNMLTTNSVQRDCTLVPAWKSSLTSTQVPWPTSMAIVLTVSAGRDFLTYSWAVHDTSMWCAKMGQKKNSMPVSKYCQGYHWQTNQKAFTKVCAHRQLSKTSVGLLGPLTKAFILCSDNISKKRPFYNINGYHHVTEEVAKHSSVEMTTSRQGKPFHYRRNI